MRSRTSIAVAIVISTSAALLAGQGSLSRPTNLRILPGARAAAVTKYSHDYFNSLVTLPAHFRSWSLRDQAQLDGLTTVGKSNYFTYVFGSDSYADPQDGAKFYKPVNDQIGQRSDSIPGNQQLRMPVRLERGTILVTWDFWYGPEFRDHIDVAKLDAYKMFQVRQNGHLWWTHLNHFSRRRESDEIAQVYESVGQRNQDIPAGLVRLKPVQPAGEGAVGGRAFSVKHGVWTRYWLELHLFVPSDDPRWNSWKSTSAAAAKLNGTWHMGSLWIADETRDPQRIIYRVPLTITHSDISSFEFEFNTSNKPPSQNGPLVGYGRNVVMLHNYPLASLPESDTRIFARPLP